MAKIIIPITERSRKYGYIYWSKTTTHQVENFLRNRSSVQLVFQGTNHGMKNIDYKYKRISVGWKWTRLLPGSSENFVLSWKDGQTLDVICR